MAILGAFYSGGKNDPKQQAQAWHMILEKYDFETAKSAVLKFAENDTRDYATFPAVGKIVEAIREEEKHNAKPYNEIKMAISYGRDYESLSEVSKSLIDKGEYNYWRSKDALWFEQNAHQLYESLGKRIEDNRRLASAT